MELFWVLGFFHQAWCSKKKSQGKRAELFQFTYFCNQIPPNQKFNLLASSHHHSLIWLELIQFFLKYAEGTMAAHNYLGSQLSRDWAGRHRNKHLQVFSCTLSPWCQHTQLLKRFAEHIYLCEVSHQFGVMHGAAWKTPVNITVITRSFPNHSVNTGTLISG